MARVTHPVVDLDPGERLLARVISDLGQHSSLNRVHIKHMNEYLVTIYTPDLAYAKRLADAINAAADEEKEQPA